MQFGCVATTDDSLNAVITAKGHYLVIRMYIELNLCFNPSATIPSLNIHQLLY